MVRLCIEPSSCVYEKLPDYDDATSIFYGISENRRQTILHELEVAVKAWQLEETVAIDIKHKHFEMPPGCVLVEEQRIQEQCSVMKPALPHEFHTLVTPFAFFFDDGTWKPYEFVVDCLSAEVGLKDLCDKKGFLEEMTQILKKHELESILGFHLIHRDHLGEEARGTIETEGDNEEELLLRPYTEELYRELVGSNGNQVMWSWCQTKSPIGHVCFSCSHTCNSHCNSHSK